MGEKDRLRALRAPIFVEYLRTVFRCYIRHVSLLLCLSELSRAHAERRDDATLIALCPAEREIGDFLPARFGAEIVRAIFVHLQLCDRLGALLLAVDRLGHARRRDQIDAAADQ